MNREDFVNKLLVEKGMKKPVDKNNEELKAYLFRKGTRK